MVAVTEAPANYDRQVCPPQPCDASRAHGHRAPAGLLPPGEPGAEALSVVTGWPGGHRSSSPGHAGPHVSESRGSVPKSLCPHGLDSSLKGPAFPILPPSAAQRPGGLGEGRSRTVFQLEVSGFLRTRTPLSRGKRSRPTQLPERAWTMWLVQAETSPLGSFSA